VPLVLVPVLFGVVTFGELEHTRLVLDAASAAGARQAAVDGQDDQAVRDRIALELRDGGLDPATASISVTPAIAAWGDPITVTVSITSRRRSRSWRMGRADELGLCDPERGDPLMRPRRAHERARLRCMPSSCPAARPGDVSRLRRGNVETYALGSAPNSTWPR